MNPEADDERISKQRALMSEEVDCLARIARLRDEQAFSRLYDLQSPLLFGLACRILARKDEAEEVLQEIMLKVWHEAGRYDAARGSARAWLIMMTRSRCLDRLRRRSTALRRESPAPQSLEQTPDDSLMAVEEMSRAEERVAVRQALDSLPEAQRRALEAAFFDGLTHAEIAVKTGDPLGTVKTRIRLGMLKLTETLKAYT